ncbi:MAG: hypothetical protein IJP03_02490 [Christensenellaceae bacterium]|nr:hypothetical protein [Christensenellaceae bacterium]
MKIQCPNCRRDNPFTLSMTVTDHGVCRYCGKVIDLTECTAYVIVRLLLVVLIGALVYLYGNEPLAAYIPNMWARIPAMLIITLIPSFIVMYVIAPIFYKRLVVREDHIKKNKLGK